MQAPSVKRGLAAAIVAAVLGYGLATSYIGRLSQHRGHHLVAVDDAVAAAPLARPRHTVFVLVDGLRADAATGLGSVATLRAAGRCVPTRVGIPTVSRPVYAVYSTGLEQDRTGARNNDETSPLAAESVWQVARRAGRRVEVRSELPWWSQLFPDGFDATTIVAASENAFAAPITADVTVVHPVYVDEAGHHHGAASAVYAAAVARVDGELAGLLAGLDLTRDLVVLTADHGHRARGGHGGPAPEIAQVLTCFAGPGVRREAPAADPSAGAAVAPATIDARSLGPALAVLLGVPFPRHLRAGVGPGEDDLDAIFAIVDPAVLGDAYLADRRAAVTRFRAANVAALGAWSDGEVHTWRAWYARGERRQQVRAALAAALLAGIVALLLRRRPGRERAGALAFVAAALVALPAGYAALSGGLDATSLNLRTQFIFNSLVGAGSALVALAWLHAVVVRRAAKLRRDLELLVVVLAGVNLGHIAVFGWPLGFPVPPRYLYFMPFLSSVFLLLAGGALGAATLAAHLRARPR